VERRQVRDAVERHRSAAQRAIGCVSTATLIVRQAVSNHAHLRPVVLNNGEPAALNNDVLIRVTYVIDTSTVVGTGISVVGYGYTLLHDSGAEIVSYQWHPRTPESVPFPHVHFGPASVRPDSAVRPGDLHKVHFPTGYVSLEEVIRLAIVEFGVNPRRGDWATILGQRSG
jgi:hypothetical protein